jgi:hypothetical protein
MIPRGGGDGGSYSADRPIGNFEKGKDLHGYLHEQPCNQPICSRNFINVASL